MHLSGAVYAETFLKEAAADNLCVNPKALSSGEERGQLRPVRADLSAGRRAGGQRLPEPEALRRAGGCVLDAQLCAVGGRQRARPVLRHLRPLRRARQYPCRRVAGRGGHACGRAERAVPGGDADAELLRSGPAVELAGLACDAWRAQHPIPRAMPPGPRAPRLDALRTKLLAGGLRDEVALDREGVGRRACRAQPHRALRRAGCRAGLLGEDSLFSTRCCARSAAAGLRADAAGLRGGQRGPECRRAELRAAGGRTARP